MKKIYKKVLLVFVSLLVAVQFSSSWILAEDNLNNTNDYAEEMDENNTAEDPSEEVKLDEHSQTDETDSTDGDKTTEENVIEDDKKEEETKVEETTTTVQGKSVVNRTVDSVSLGIIEDLFEDEYFAEYIAEYLNKTVNDTVTQAELNTITYVNLYNYLEVSDLSGIHQLENLSYLEISGTKVKNLDAVHDLTELDTINAYDAENLVSINGMKNLPKISTINIQNSAVKKIGDFADDVQINYLMASNSAVSKISSLENQNELTNLNLSSNKLTSIDDMGEVAALTSLDVSSNNITNLDTLNAPMLTSLAANDNKITSIDGIGNSSDIQYLELQNNLLKSVSVLKNCTTIYSINLKNNNLQNVDGLQDLSNVWELDLTDNSITNLNAFSTNTLNINNLYLDNNKLTNLDGIESISTLNNVSAENNQLENINAVSELSYLASLNVSNNNISTVTLSNEMSNLSELKIANNQLNNIDFLKKCTYLQMYGYNLDLSNNNITSLSAFDDIAYISISNIDLSGNKITSLSSLSGLGASYIYDFNISNNQISSLDGLNSDIQVIFLDASNNLFEGDHALDALNNITSNLSQLTLSNAQITNAMFDNVNWTNMSGLYGTLDLSYNKLTGADQIYTYLLSNLPNPSGVIINLAGNEFDNFDFIEGGHFEYLDLSGTGFNDFELLNKANYIGGLGLSSNGYTDEDLEELSKLEIDVIVNLNSVDLSSNKLTKLDFLEYLAKKEDYNYNSNLEVILDNNDFSTLDVSVLESFNDNGYMTLRLSLANSNISDLSSFNGQSYDINLRLNLDENHISDITPLYTHYDFLADLQPGDSTQNIELSIQNQTITIDNEIIVEDSTFTIENIVKHLNGSIVEPSLISNNGSYAGTQITWDLADVDIEDGMVTTYYDFSKYLTTNENIATRYAAIPNEEAMYFSGRVTINTKVNSTSEVEDVYTITYDGNGHTSGDVPVDTSEYDENALVCILGQNTLKKTGYTFLGWSKDATATTADYAEGDTLTINEDITLYAVWDLDNDPTNPVDPDPINPTDPDPIDPDPSDPSEPTDPTQPIESGKPTDPSESVASGDTTNWYLWLGLATIGGFASLLVVKKKREESK